MEKVGGKDFHGSTVDLAIGSGQKEGSFGFMGLDSGSIKIFGDRGGSFSVDEDLDRAEI